MLTIRPQPAASMSGRIARVHRNGPLRLTAIIRSHASTAMSRNAQKPVMPALLTRIVTGPSSARVRAAAPAMSSSEDASIAQAIARPPAFSMSTTVSSAPARFKSQTATAAPSAASWTRSRARFRCRRR